MFKLRPRLRQRCDLGVQPGAREVEPKQRCKTGARLLDQRRNARAQRSEIIEQARRAGTVQLCLRPRHRQGRRRACQRIERVITRAARLRRQLGRVPKSDSDLIPSLRDQVGNKAAVLKPLKTFGREARLAGLAPAHAQGTLIPARTPLDIPLQGFELMHSERCAIAARAIEHMRGEMATAFRIIQKMIPRPIECCMKLRNLHRSAARTARGDALEACALGRGGR